MKKMILQLHLDFFNRFEEVQWIFQTMKTLVFLNA